MPTSTHFNSLESEFDAMALTEFGAERTDLDWPLEVTRGGFFEAETKADKPVFKQARLRGAPELFGGRGLYQIFRSGKRIYPGESNDLGTRLQQHRWCLTHMELTPAELDHYTVKIWLLLGHSDEAREKRTALEQMLAAAGQLHHDKRKQPDRSDGNGARLGYVGTRGIILKKSMPLWQWWSTR